MTRRRVDVYLALLDEGARPGASPAKDLWDLAARAGDTIGVATQQLRRLEAAGLLELQPRPALTPKGKAHVEALREAPEGDGLARDAAGPAERARALRVLVVDDSPSIRLLLAHAVRATRPDAAIEEAADRDEAVARFRETAPDVVFLDMMLAKRDDGLGVLQTMLSDRPAASVVLVTGLPRAHPDIVDAIATGASAYLEKPARHADVARVLGEVLAESGVEWTSSIR